MHPQFTMTVWMRDTGSSNKPCVQTGHCGWLHLLVINNYSILHLDVVLHSIVNNKEKTPCVSLIKQQCRSSVTNHSQWSVQSCMHHGTLTLHTWRWGWWDWVELEGSFEDGPLKKVLWISTKLQQIRIMHEPSIFILHESLYWNVSKNIRRQCWDKAEFATV